MAYTNWQNSPTTTTPLSAANLNQLTGWAVSVGGGFYNVKADPYNAVGDGSADDTTAIQAALSAARTAGGGTVLFPPGIYKYTSALNIDQGSGIVLQGVSRNVSELRYSGAGSAAAISCNTTSYCIVEKLRLTYSNASYTGNLLSFDWGSPTGDCTQITIRDCFFGGFPNTLTNARSLIRWNRVIVSRIERNHFWGATTAIYLGDTNYVVSATLRDNTYNGMLNHPVTVNGSIENVRFVQETYEPLAGANAGKAGAVKFQGTSAAVYAVVWENCWSGDTSTAGNSWIEWNQTGGWLGGGIYNCRWAGITTADPAFKVGTSGSSLQSFNIVGNQFSGAGPPLNFGTGGAFHFGVRIERNENSTGSAYSNMNQLRQSRYDLAFVDEVYLTRNSANDRSYRVYFEDADTLTTLGTSGKYLDTNSDNLRFTALNLVVDTVGKGLKVKEGTNAKMGTATLVAGTVTVSTTAVTANSRVFLTGQNSSGTHGQLTVSARTAGTSFTITSSSGTDTRSVAWMLVEPS